MKTIHPPHHHNGFVAMRRISILVCLHDFTLLYYALSFALVEHSVCHETIYIYIYIYIYIPRGKLA